MDQSYYEEGVRLRPIQTKFEKRASDISSKDESQEGNGRHDDDDDDQPLSPAGQIFYEPNMNVHSLAIFGCKTKIDPAVIRANLPLTLLKHSSRFCSFPVEDEKKGGEMKWVRTNVDWDKHVIIPDEEDYLSKENPDEYLDDYVHNLAKTSVDKSRPLWDLHILNLKTSGAEAVLILRVHHSIGDGTSLISLLLDCARQSSDPEAKPNLPTTKLKLRPDRINNRSLFCFPAIINYFLCLILRVWSVLKLFWNTFWDVLMFMGTSLLLIKDSQTPIKRSPGFEKNAKRIVFRIVSLDDIKLVKNALNTTINDVALGVTQAGLSKYLNRRYGMENKNDEGQTEKKNNLPKKFIRLRSILFTNMRTSQGAQGSADMMEKNKKVRWGNLFAYLFIPFTIGLRDDPLDYVREVKPIMDRKKHSLERNFTFFVIGLVFKFLGTKCLSVLFHRLFNSTTVTFSNVVGPLEEINLLHHPIAYLAANAYAQADNELGVFIQSYVSKMTICLAVDESTIPDPYELCDDIVESLELMKKSVIEKGLL